MFFPLKDETPAQGKPYVAMGLIILNSLIFIVASFLPERNFRILIYQYGLIPYELVHLTELTPKFPAPVLLTPFTSMFLHGGWIHLIGNMLFLWIFGNNIEDYLGHIKFLLFYLVSGLAAIFLFVVFSPNLQVPMVGASGAIAGVLGAYFLLFPRSRILTLIWIFYYIRLAHVPAKAMLGFWFLYQLLMSAIATGSGGSIAFLAHVGGFIFGWAFFKVAAAEQKE